MSRTKLFLVLYFLPPWIASLLQWGDDRTSSGFTAAPLWYFQLQLLTQYSAMLLLFFPPWLRPRPSLAVLFLSIVTIVALNLANPIIEAEYILTNGSILIALIAIFLALAQPGATVEVSDIALLFYLFLVGFALQILLYLQFGIMPSHSITDVFIRFNGITNDSLSTGFIIALFIPWAVNSRFSLLKVLVILGEAFATGSLFGVVFVSLATFGYLLYYRHYRLVLTILACMVAVAIAFYETLYRILEVKFLSILTHLRFFLDLTGASYERSRTVCSEEFCESLVESGLNLSPVYLVAFYGLMLCFIVPLFQRVPRSAPASALPASPLIADTLRILGAGLFIGSFVHPVPLIPFALPLFLIFTSMYLGRLTADRPGAVAPARPLNLRIHSDIRHRIDT